ncbi:hypothetical protein KCP70_04960 [Salmonella enterica subsp. enterica]|nr:hypothetical protein KCP70_04960 [Salmonella enterica subsp. enterica]
MLPVSMRITATSNVYPANLTAYPSFWRFHTVTCAIRAKFLPVLSPHSEKPCMSKVLAISFYHRYGFLQFI